MLHCFKQYNSTNRRSANMLKRMKIKTSNNMKKVLANKGVPKQLNMKYHRRK